MAITSLDGVISGMRPPEDILKVGAAMQAAGVLHSLFYAAGRPGAGSASADVIAGVALTTLTGQIPFTNPSSGNSYLARLEASGSQIGTLFLLDRLWHNANINVSTTTAQTVNSVAFPARDRDGSTNGENVLVAIEVSTAVQNNSEVTNCTLSYTNSSGTSGKTATLAAIPANSVAGTFLIFSLAAGDTGIRSIQSLTLGANLVAGTIHLVAFRRLAILPITQTNVGAAIDAISSGFPRMYNNTVPFPVWLANSVTAVTVNGQMIVTQG